MTETKKDERESEGDVVRNGEKIEGRGDMRKRPKGKETDEENLKTW